MRSIKEIKEYLENQSIENLGEALEEFCSDERKGVQKLIESGEKRIEAGRQEADRLEKLLLYEKRCYEQGYELVAGIDEVGRGPLAGPVVAAAVILPKGCKIEGVDDSKKLSAKKREALYDIIIEKAVAYGIGMVSNEEIDEINILQATYEAMRQALDKLEVQPDVILVDAVTIPRVGTPQKAIVKGDSKSISIGAASIVAKVYRDRIMEAYEDIYPGYGFSSNKGYGAKVHVEALLEKGLTPIHRRSFVKKILSASDSRTKGIAGEEIAAHEMKKMGYEIIEKNYHSRFGEIDIIAKKEDTTIFVEVKLRKSRTNHYGVPSEAVDGRKQRKIIQTAEAYLVQHTIEGDCRFDVAEILIENGKTYFRYLEDAFRQASD